MIDIRVGDCREVLATLPERSVQCVVTSPPYYNLRDYNVPGQMGLEPTLREYIDGMVDVFRSVRDVLADDGTLWLNIGDSYNTSGTRQGDRDGGVSDGRNEHRRFYVKRQPALKEKDLMMVPARLAIALQDDGWYLRSDIIWHKPNPMPESVTDRPTSAHEHIFLLTKQSRYYYDADAIREPLAASSVSRLSQDVDAQEGSRRANGGAKTNGTMKAVWPGIGKQHADARNRNDQTDPIEIRAGANARNVWSISTVGYPGAHFATFPPEIPRRCILAGSREGDTILDPFAGAGTTLLVADRLGRNGIGIELNPEYADLARNRIRNDAPLLAEVTP